MSDPLGHPENGYGDWSKADLIAEAYALVETGRLVPADLHARLLAEGCDIQPFT